MSEKTHLPDCMSFVMMAISSDASVFSSHYICICSVIIMSVMFRWQDIHYIMNITGKVFFLLDKHGLVDLNSSAFREKCF